MIKRCPETGKFVRVNSNGDVADDTFVRVTNEDIYEAVQSLDSRLRRVETRLATTAHMWAMVTPTITCVAGVIASIFYLRGH